jgi:DNA topoisomerase-1
MTQLERLQKTGIQRLGTPKSGFRYESANGGSVSRADLARIKALRIPPAWTNVAINRSAKGMLQAVGTDAAGRSQYLYHENHVRKREQKKFGRLLAFAQALPKMRRVVARDLRRPELDREKVMACILRILSTCFMRPGSEVYASENGSYGIATLRPRHVKVKGDVVEFDFRGKSGVRQQRELRDRSVAKVVRGLLQQRAPEVFKYRNHEGKFVDIKRHQINVYIKEVMGDRFSAKDFRTWAGTLICACALARASRDLEDSRKGKKKKIVEAVKETADMLGNTPAVCRSAYICPLVLDSFEEGKVIDQYFETVEDLVGHRGVHLHQAERALLRLLKRRSR